MTLKDKTRAIQKHFGTTVDGAYGDNTADAIIAGAGIVVGGFDKGKFLAQFVNLNADAIGDADYAKAAQVLKCDEPAIRAVSEVEARGSGFLPSGRPKILFERHIFWRETKGRHGVSDISSSTPGGYKGGEAEYDRLAKAATLDEDAALKSASWGAYQIMGFNHAMCGYADVQSYVKAMVESEGNHLAAFVAFLGTARLDRHLRAHDWAKFARGYNGPAYAKNSYDKKMAAAYRRYAK